MERTIHTKIVINKLLTIDMLILCPFYAILFDNNGKINYNF